MAEERTCIGCEGPADFTMNIVAYKLRSSPKVNTSTKSIGLCGRCVEASSQHYEGVGRVLVCWAFQVHNDLEAKSRQQIADAVDRKSAAGGA